MKIRIVPNNMGIKKLCSKGSTHNLTLIKFSTLVLILITISSCHRLSENERLLENNCDIKINELRLVNIKDSINSPYSYPISIFQFRASLSITNKGRKSVFIQFNSLYNSDYNCEIIASLPGFMETKFYKYPFMYQYGIVGPGPIINSGKTVVCYLETPIMMVHKDDKPNYLLDLNKIIDSLKVYVKTTENSNFKKEIKCLNLKKSIKQVSPPTIGRSNGDFF